MIFSDSKGRAGGCFGVASSPRHPPTSTNPRFLNDVSANESRSQFDFFLDAIGRIMHFWPALKSWVAYLPVPSDEAIRSQRKL
jgi:hypothetical protein